MARAAVVLAAAFGAWLYLGDHSVQGFILGAVALAIAYNVVLMGLIRLGHVQAAFQVGFALDHLTLVGVWWAVVALGDGGPSNDIYLVLFPILVVGVVRIGWPWALAYSLLLVTAIGWLEWRYQPASSYAAQQLPLRVGFLGLVGVLAAVLVYQLQRAKRAAEAHGETMDAIQRSMTEGLLVVGGDGRIVFCNPTAKSLLGVSDSARVVSRDLEGLLDDQLLSNHSSKFIETVRSVAAGAASTDTVYVGDDATQPVHYALTAFPIDLGGSLMTGVLMRDVTEQWEVEQLQYRFVSIAAHELRTPLTSVMGFSELLQTRQPTEDQRQKWVGYINAEAHRLTSILDQILNVGKIRSGESDALELETVDVGAVVQQIVEESHATTGTRKLGVDLAGPLPVIITDQGKVKQVLAILLSNAVKYSPDGSEIVVDAHVDDSRSHLIIDVTDQGIGIAEHDRHRLFASFSRIPQPGNEGVRGAGLGLFICRRLAQSLGGDVWLKESEPGVGSTFTFAIPLDGGSFTAQAA